MKLSGRSRAHRTPRGPCCPKVRYDRNPSRPSGDSTEEPIPPRSSRSGEENSPAMLAVPWSSNTGSEIKGIIHSPSEGPGRHRRTERLCSPRSRALEAGSKIWRKAELLLSLRSPSVRGRFSAISGCWRHLHSFRPALCPILLNPPWPGPGLRTLRKHRVGYGRAREEWFGAPFGGEAALVPRRR